MTAPLSFRPADASDIPVLHALIEGAYRGETARQGWTHEADMIATPRTSAEELAGIIALPDSRMLTAWHDNSLIGTVHIARRAPGGAYLGMLTVDPAAQAGGLGKQILAHAETQAAQIFGARSMTMWVITGRPELIAFYERRGYAPTGETEPYPVPLDPPLEFAVLRKALI